MLTIAPPRLRFEPGPASDGAAERGAHEVDAQHSLERLVVEVVRARGRPDPRDVHPAGQRSEAGCHARRLLVRGALSDVALDGDEPLAELVCPRCETLLVAVETHDRGAVPHQSRRPSRVRYPTRLR